MVAAMIGSRKRLYDSGSDLGDPQNDNEKDPLAAPIPLRLECPPGGTGDATASKKQNSSDSKMLHQNAFVPIDRAAESLDRKQPKRNSASPDAPWRLKMRPHGIVLPSLEAVDEVTIRPHAPAPTASEGEARFLDVCTPQPTSVETTSMITSPPDPPKAESCEPDTSEELPPGVLLPMFD